MNEGKTFNDLPQADSIPNGSLYAVEMGDSSGTKKVTHEQVIGAVADALPLGNTRDLETNAKNNFVAAINEIKERTDHVQVGAVIKVNTTDPGLYGQPVTVTDGETVLTGSMSYTGRCEIAGVTMAGDLTVSCTSTEQVTAKVVIHVEAYATYTVTLESRGNILNLTTTEPSLFGAEITVSNGTDSASGEFDNNGSASVPFHFAGNVTVTASDGNNTASAAVTVAPDTYAAYSAELKLYHVSVTVAGATTATITKGENSRTANFVDGTAELVFDSSFVGECTLSATDGQKSSKDTLTVTAGTYTYTATFKLGVIYTAILDLSKSDPSNIVTYEDDAAGMDKDFSQWRLKEIFKDLKNCILKDGEVQYYLNPDNFTQKEDGTASDITTLGNDVMLEIPMRLGYMIEWIDSGKTKLKVSVTNEPDNENYNYDAFSLDSYNDCDRIYIGAFKGHGSGNKVYSSSGKAIANTQTIDTFRSWCRARGAGYQQRTYASVKLMQCLYIISHGTLNSQAAVGAGYVLSSHTAGVNTGGTNAYGFDSEIIRASNPTYMTDRNHQVKCLGLEDFWGNSWEFVDGLCSGASRNILTCTCAKDFNTQGSGYDDNGNGGVTANLGNYMNLPQGGSKAGFTARVVSGSDSTYFCDYAALKASCLAVFGGGCDAALGAGAFELSVHAAFSLSGAGVGCRLMYLHKEEVEEQGAA